MIEQRTAGTEPEWFGFCFGGNMKKYDIVYILKNDVKPDEIRYSLRSIEQNLEHGNVWFFGGIPEGIRPDRAYLM